MGRRVRFVLFGLVALQLLYLVAANLVLHFGIIPRALRRSTQQARLNWASAWSPWYGRVYVRGFSLRFDDDNDVQLDIGAGRATVDLSLIDLARGRVTLTTVRADGVSYRMVTKVTKAQARALPQRVAAFPPSRVQGFSPVKKGGPQIHRTPEQIDQLWRVELRDASATLSEVWLDEYRYCGPGRVHGGFIFEPQKSITLAPTRLELVGGTLSAGPSVVSRDFTLGIDAVITPITHLEGSPVRVLRGVTGRLRSGFTLDSLDAAAMYSDAAHVEGDGRVRADVSVLQGTVSRDSRFELRLGHLEARVKGFAFSGQTNVNAAASEEHGLALSAVLAGDLKSPPLRGVPLELALPRVTASLELSTRDLAARPKLVRLTANAPDVSAKDARPLTQPVAEKVPVLAKAVLGAGPLTGSASLTVTPDATLVSVEQARLGSVVAQGAAQRPRGEPWRGAAAGALGRIHVGMSLTGGKPELHLVVAKDWLRGELERAGIHPDPPADGS